MSFENLLVMIRMNLWPLFAQFSGPSISIVMKSKGFNGVKSFRGPGVSFFSPYLSRKRGSVWI